MRSSGNGQKGGSGKPPTAHGGRRAALLQGLHDPVLGEARSAAARVRGAPGDRSAVHLRQVRRRVRDQCRPAAASHQRARAQVRLRPVPAEVRQGRLSAPAQGPRAQVPQALHLPPVRQGVHAQGQSAPAREPRPSRREEVRVRPVQAAIRLAQHAHLPLRQRSPAAQVRLRRVRQALRPAEPPEAPRGVGASGHEAAQVSRVPEAVRAPRQHGDASSERARRAGRPRREIGVWKKGKKRNCVMCIYIYKRAAYELSM